MLRLHRREERVDEEKQGSEDSKSCHSWGPWTYLLDCNLFKEEGENDHHFNSPFHTWFSFIYSHTSIVNNQSASNITCTLTRGSDHLYVTFYLSIWIFYLSTYLTGHLCIYPARFSPTSRLSIYLIYIMCTLTRDSDHLYVYV